MRIIPAIDLLNGKCVRLKQGQFLSQKVYRENPLDMAYELEQNGMEYLHLVDLDGARKGHIQNYKVLHSIASKTRLSIDFGGGIKSNEAIRIAFENGARQITGGSIAVENKTLFKEWIQRYGADKIILGADCKNGTIATNAWQASTEIDAVDFILEYEQQGINYVISTDIEKDGMLTGPSFDLYSKIKKTTSVQLIASGGIASKEDLIRLKKMGCEAAIVGKAIYEGNISLKELMNLC